MTTRQATLQPFHRTHSLRAVLLLLMCAGLSAVMPLVQHAEVYAMTAVLFVLVAGPAWFDWQRGRLDLFEPIHMVGVISFLYFGMGSIWTLQDPARMSIDRYAVPYIPQALFYCVLGYAALLIAYRGPWWGPPPTRRNEEVLGNALFLLLPGIPGLLGCMAFSTATRSFLLGSRVSVIVSSLSTLIPLFMFAWGMAWLLFFAGQRPRWLLWILFGVFCPGLAPVILSTMNDKSLTLTFAGIPLIALWYAKRKFPWRTILILVLVLIFVVFPVYNTFRLFDPRLSNGERLSLTYSAMNDWSGDAYMDRSFGSFKARLALINSVAVVIRDTGRWVPYAYGETIILPTVVFLIPRVIWPEKPTFLHGRTFGEKFRLLHPLDRKTFIASSVPGELYWNFDLPGIVIGMALWGCLLRFLYRRYGESSNLDSVRKAIYIALLVGIANMGEGHVAAHLNGLIRLVVITEVLRWIGRYVGWIGVRSLAADSTGETRVAPVSEAA